MSLARCTARHSGACRCAPIDFAYPRGSRFQPKQGSDSSRRARDTAATTLHFTHFWRHRGESAMKHCQLYNCTCKKCVYMNISDKNWPNNVEFRGNFHRYAPSTAGSQEINLTVELSNPISTRLTDLCGIRSLVPHLIGPPSHWSPSHWSPNSLVPQYIIGAHWSPISLVPHITGPPSHWSPFSFVTPSSANPNGPPSHWFPISLVPQLISLPSHWSPNWHPCITHSIGPPSHWSPRLIGPPSHWSPNSLVPFSLVPQFISPQLHIGPPFHSSTQFRPIPMVPHLILTGPLSHWSPNWHPHTAHSIGPPSHWSPIALVPSHRLGPQFISPHRVVWTH